MIPAPRSHEKPAFSSPTAVVDVRSADTGTVAETVADRASVTAAVDAPANSIALYSGVD
jgi:hypothetical protein